MERMERMGRPVAGEASARAPQHFSTSGAEPMAARPGYHHAANSAAFGLRPGFDIGGHGGQDFDRSRGTVARPAWPASGTGEAIDVPAGALEGLRSEVVSLRERLANAAPRRAVEEMDRALTLLHNRVETLHEDGQTLLREDRRGLSLELSALRHSVDALRAPERHEALAAAVEALAGKVDRMADAAVDPAEVSRLQGQSSELRVLLTRALSSNGLQALAGRIAACAEEVARAGEESARRVSAVAVVLERNAQALLAGTERLEQHIAARAEVSARDQQADAAASAELHREVAGLRGRLETLGTQLAAQATTWSPAARADLAGRLDEILKAVEQRAAEVPANGPLVEVVERHLVALTDRFRDTHQRLGRLDAIEHAILRMTEELRQARAETAAATAEAMQNVALKLSGDAGAPAVLGLKRGLAALEARQEDLERRAEAYLGDAYGAGADDFAPDAAARGPYADAAEGASYGAGVSAARDFAAQDYPAQDYSTQDYPAQDFAERDFAARNLAPPEPAPLDVDAREPASAARHRDGIDAADAAHQRAESRLDGEDDWSEARPARDEAWPDLARAEARAFADPDGDGAAASARRFNRRSTEDAAAAAAAEEAPAHGRRVDWSAGPHDARPRVQKGFNIRKRSRQHRSALFALLAGAAMVLATTAAGLAWSNGVSVTSALTRLAGGPPPTSGLPAPMGTSALQAAARAGDISAAFEVGSRYAEGRGVTADMGAAVKWLGYALSQGLVPAAYRLGSLYETVSGDFGEALRFYEWAAAQGHVRAMHNLGVIYSRGQVPGTEGKPDWAHAVRWFEQAAERGNRDSQYNLGVINARGLAGTTDLESAWKWFTLASVQGDEESARKRDAIAERMDVAAVARARKAADGFAPQPVSAAANVVVQRPEWDVAAPDDKVAARVQSRGQVLAANTATDRSGGR